MKKSSLISLSLITLLVLTNCTWVGTNKNINIIDKSNSINLQSSFYLIHPKNGSQTTFFNKDLKENVKSAEEVIKVLKPELLKTVGSLTISNQNIDLKQGLKNAKLEGSKYLINIDINEWKDAFYGLCAPSSNPSGAVRYNPPTLDTVDLTMSIYDVKTQTLINRQRVENRGCPIVLFGVIPIGKNSPESRFKDMISTWITNIK